MDIVTLTLNPVLDKNTGARLVEPEKKIRCNMPAYAPGGGGINVSRAMKKLGGDSKAVFLAGGANGKRIASLLDEEGIRYRRIETEINTRENLSVYEETTGKLYRFGMPGRKIGDGHWKAALDQVTSLDPPPGYLVASGSLPPGAPDDFYRQLAAWAKEKHTRMVLDTSGPPLNHALEEGVYLAKPNLRELSGFLNKEVLTGMELEEAAKEMLKKEHCRVLVLSMGPRGAMLAYDNDRIDYIVPPIMPVQSTVGAGDSMVAGILIGFSKDMEMKRAVQFGIAAGTAATMTPGSELCRWEDTAEIFDWIRSRSEEE